MGWKVYSASADQKIDLEFNVQCSMLNVLMFNVLIFNFHRNIIHHTKYHHTKYHRSVPSRVPIFS